MEKDSAAIAARQDDASSNIRQIHDIVSSIINTRSDGRLKSTEFHGNLYTSTHNSGIVSCTFADESSETYFWKVGKTSTQSRLGRLAGVGYEANVYTCFEHMRPCPAPEFIGQLGDEHSTVFVIQYLKDAYRLNKTPEKGAVAGAAARIGEFQSRGLSDTAVTALQMYDESIYSLIAAEAARSGRSEPWLDQVVDEFPKLATSLQSHRPTLLHGEFFPGNILVSKGGIVPVDWEWAGIGLGELDLAALIEAWDEQIQEAAICAYAWSRGFYPSDPDFKLRLAVAKLYFLLRRMGREPTRERPSRHGPQARVDGKALARTDARRLAQELGITSSQRRRR